MDGWMEQGYSYIFIPLSSKEQIKLLIGVSNAFNCRPAVPVVFQHLPHHLINVAPGFVINHFHASMRHGRRK